MPEKKPLDVLAELKNETRKMREDAACDPLAGTLEWKVRVLECHMASLMWAVGTLFRIADEQQKQPNTQVERQP